MNHATIASVGGRSLRSTVISLLIPAMLSSCSTLEKASLHGFHSSYYTEALPGNQVRKVYVDVQDEHIAVYPLRDQAPDTTSGMTIPLPPAQDPATGTLVFRKQSLDVDLTSVIFKYHPALYGLPPQLTTDFNVAVYAGWRHDTYLVRRKRDPLGKSHARINNRGYDFGVFAGPGATTISPFTTRNALSEEYSGLVIQTGFAGFIESSIASVGVSVGYDHLMNSDRDVWIYHRKPWIGFMVGIALN